MSGRAFSILFPDAAALACTVLASGLPEHGFAGTPTGTRVPAQRPAQFVRVLRTGGLMDTAVTDWAQLTIESWADEEETAQDLAQMCRALIMGSVGSTVNGSTVIAYGEMSAPQNLPDPTSAQPRYSFTIRLRLRGQAL